MKEVLVLFWMFQIGFLTINAQQDIPNYMKSYTAKWNDSPKKAALEWFKSAKFGMFIHFSPASILKHNSDFAKLDKDWFARHTLATQPQKVMDEYAYKEYLYDKLDHIESEVQKLIQDFRPDRFDADSIADLAVKAGMRYITFTTQHVCGRLFMFDTSISKCNSVRICGRDFVKELSEACQQRGLGLFLYVMPPSNLLEREIKTMLRELLTHYGPIAGIWFDGIWCAYNRPDDYLSTSEFYSYINELQPQCLISFKTGFTGDEDFLSPEWHQLKYKDNGDIEIQGRFPLMNKKMPILRLEGGKKVWKYQSFSQVWLQELRYKPIELSTTMIKGNIWFDQADGIHKNENEILKQYKIATEKGANLLLNVAPCGDGSIHPADYSVLQNLREKICR